MNENRRAERAARRSAATFHYLEGQGAEVADDADGRTFLAREQDGPWLT